MKKLSLIIAIVIMTINVEAQNPLLSEFNTLHGTAPFEEIKTAHYEPAIKEGIRQNQAEIDAICNNPEAPSFENTIVAMERSGQLLGRVTSIFFNLMEADTNDEMQELATRIMPALTEHGNNINLNEKLFERVKYVYEHCDKQKLNAEDLKLLEDTYKSFSRNGANLNPEHKAEYRRLANKLSTLGLQFSQNVLKATNSFELLITDPKQVEGMPETVLDAAKQTAQEKGKEGWMFTLSAPSYIPFMTFNPIRELRQQMSIASGSKTAQNNEYNNFEIVREIVNTKMSIAQLLGYKDYASYSLEKSMAENSESVYQLLNQLLKAYKPTALKEAEEVEEFAKKTEGAHFKLMPWDWSYYAEKLKDSRYNVNAEMLRPYFEINQVINGVFGLATKLYGITFQENKKIQVYHPDVKAYEVFDKDGSFLAVLYADFYPRESKRAGAWMTEFKSQWKENGENSRPHISIVMNFTKPTADKPALLTFDELETFLHEFGHSLHGMFANTTYASMSGTSVYRDFVELPSQFMENFAIEKEFLHTFAKHYQTGELIPDSLIQRIVDASNFNSAYGCLRQLSFGFLDMAWYTQDKPFEGNIIEFENEAWKQTQILPIVEGNCMSTQFSHIFAGGYSAGYYSYKWSEVLDADAFSLFKEKGIFDRKTADSFRYELLEKGGTVHPMTLYTNFRGKKPSIDALLKRNGILK